MSGLVPIPGAPSGDPDPGDTYTLPIWVLPPASVISPKGKIGVIQCVPDNEAATAACIRKRALVQLPTFRLSIAPPVIMISRKTPFERGADYVRESLHPGVFCEFYHNPRGRFMRISDSYRHAVYQLARARFVDHPVGFPDPEPDLDLGWFP